MIRKISIEKLFGRYNYQLEFNKFGILILTGPNGYGKSTILRLVNYIVNDSFEKCLDVNFCRLTIDCVNSSLVIDRNESGVMINGIQLARYKDNLYPSFVDDDDIRISRQRNMVSLRHDIIENGNVNASLLMEEMFKDRFFANNIDRVVLLKKADRIKRISDLTDAYEAIGKVKKEIGRVSFITEQRLMEKKVINEDVPWDEFEYVPVINEDARKLKETLSNIMKMHSSVASELDSTYIKRLFSADEVIDKDLVNANEELEKLHEKQIKLKKYGLAEMDSVSYVSSIEEEKLDRYYNEIDIYIKDAKKKYNVFEEVIDKLDLFEKIVNQKLKFKKVELSLDDGIAVISDEGIRLNLAELSSGEQEIIVLFYKLIFESDVNLLMIDEPEISLHIAWQKEIMDNLKEVVALDKSIQVIVATHSPQIISNNWDIQVDLGGQYNDQFN